MNPRVALNSIYNGIPDFDQLRDHASPYNYVRDGDKVYWRLPDDTPGMTGGRPSEFPEWYRPAKVFNWHKYLDQSYDAFNIGREYHAGDQVRQGDQVYEKIMPFFLDAVPPGEDGWEQDWSLVEGPIKPYARQDPLRFKVIKCLTIAFWQVADDPQASWMIPEAGDDGYHRFVFRGWGPDTTFGVDAEVPYVSIRDRILRSDHLIDAIDDPFAHGSSTTTTAYEVLIQGFFGDASSERHADFVADHAYPMAEAIRSRISLLPVDVRQNDGDLFRLTGANRALRILVSAGNLEGDSSRAADFYMKIDMKLIEDFSDSTSRREHAA